MKNLIKTMLLCSFLSVTFTVLGMEGRDVQERTENIIRSSNPQEQQEAVRQWQERQHTIESHRKQETIEKSTPRKLLDSFWNLIGKGDIGTAEKSLLNPIKSFNNTDYATNITQDAVEHIQKLDTDQKSNLLNKALDIMKNKGDEAFINNLGNPHLQSITLGKYKTQVDTLIQQIVNRGMLNHDQHLEITDPGTGIKFEYTGKKEDLYSFISKLGRPFDITFEVVTDATRAERAETQQQIEVEKAAKEAKEKTELAAKQAKEAAEKQDVYNKGKAATREKLSNNLSGQGFNDIQISNISNLILDQNITFQGLKDFDNLLKSNNKNFGKILKALKDTTFSKNDKLNLPTKLQNLQDVAKIIPSLPKDWTKDDRANIANAMLGSKLTPEDQNNFDAFMKNETNADTVREAINNSDTSQDQKTSLLKKLSPTPTPEQQQSVVGSATDFISEQPTEAAQRSQPKQVPAATNEGNLTKDEQTIKTNIEKNQTLKTAGINPTLLMDLILNKKPIYITDETAHQIHDIYKNKTLIENLLKTNWIDSLSLSGSSASRIRIFNDRLTASLHSIANPIQSMAAPKQIYETQQPAAVPSTINEEQSKQSTQRTAEALKRVADAIQRAKDIAAEEKQQAEAAQTTTIEPEAPADANNNTPLTPELTPEQEQANILAKFLENE